ncbi:MAG: hypothetical protein AABY06_00530 [Nanoarchaeota archaeon]
MTKNNLVKKVLSGAKNFAFGASLFALPLLYSSNANAQTKDKFVEGAKISVLSPSGGIVQGEMQKIHNHWYSVVDDKENKANNVLGIALVDGETLDRVGSYTGGNILFKPNLYFIPEQAKDSAGNVAGRIELQGQGVFAADGKKTKEIIEESSKPGENTLYIAKIGNQELLIPLYGITLSGSTYFVPFLPSKNDSLVESGKKLNFASIPTSDKKGHSTKQIVEYDGDVSLANPEDVYTWKLDESRSTKDIYENAELLKKLLVDGTYPSSELKISQNTGECKKFLQYTEEENAEEKEEKTPSNINGRIKAGVGYTIPKGFEASINPQIQLSENSFLGPYVSFSNSSKSLEKITNEEGFRQVVSVPADMYFVSTGTEIKENTKITNALSLGLNFSYKLSENMEAFVKAGLLGQKIEKTMTSSGEEYMEIAGAKEDVQSYNESNTSITNKSLFKGSPVYVGAGAEYFPLKGKKILENISVYGEAGYINGEYSGALGSLGIKYTLTKPKKQEK